MKCFQKRCTPLQHLFTEGLQVDVEGEGVAARLLVALTLGKVKVESQQGHGEERRQLPQLGRLDGERGGERAGGREGEPEGRREGGSIH